MGCGILARMGDTVFGHSAASWEAAKAEAKALLAEAARGRRTLAYCELCDGIRSIRIEPRSFALMRMLNEVCSEEDAERGVMLASLVVRRDSGIPGDGYFHHAASLGRDVSDREAFWRAEVERIWAAYGDGAAG